MTGVAPAAGTDLPDPARVLAAMEATWAPAARQSLGPWILRDGAGGGQRVSAATAEGPVGPGDIAAMEAAQRDLGQRPLVMIRPHEAALDAELAARGYGLVDPVLLRLAPVAGFAPPAPVRAFAHWPPLALTAEIWDRNDIDAARRAVMARVAGPKAAVLARTAEKLNRSAGTGFVAVSGDIAMVHAMVVLPELRRQGCANQIMREAAGFAQDHGARWLGLAVTRDNGPANGLYASLGMQVVGQYHYRRL